VVQTRLADAVPSTDTYWPGTQDAHAPQVDALVAVLKVPAPQGAQARSTVEVPASATKRPAPHANQDAHVTAFVPDEKPPTHGRHVRSVVAETTPAWYVPAAHVVQGVQATAFAAALNVPLAQGAQTRSSIALPEVDANFPATHVVKAAQAVAGSPSWSQVPLAHGTDTAAPPAQ
jgi:hypothetical protein